VANIDKAADSEINASPVEQWQFSFVTVLCFDRLPEFDTFIVMNLVSIQRALYVWKVSEHDEIPSVSS